MQVSEIMRDGALFLQTGDSVSKAAQLMHRYNIGSLPVCGSDGQLKGIVTDRDIVLRCVAAETDPMDTSVREIMTRAVQTVAPTDDIREASKQMGDKQVRRLPVVEKGKLVGMLSLADIARTRSFSMEASKALSEISQNVHKR